MWNFENIRVFESLSPARRNKGSKSMDLILSMTYKSFIWYSYAVPKSEERPSEHDNYSTVQFKLMRSISHEKLYKYASHLQINLTKKNSVILSI